VPVVWPIAPEFKVSRLHSEATAPNATIAFLSIVISSLEGDSLSTGTRDTLFLA
jgi:hypothetical protein